MVSDNLFPTIARGFPSIDRLFKSVFLKEEKIFVINIMIGRYAFSLRVSSFLYRE